jgi:hypothetical protein
MVQLLSVATVAAAEAAHERAVGVQAGVTWGSST